MATSVGFLARVESCLRSSRFRGIFFVVIFVTGFIIRIDILRFPVYQGAADYNLDYLLAHHIVAYGELPLAGPEGGLGRFPSSPLYLYLLASPLFLVDHILILGFFNVLLQMGALVLVFMLARALFGNATALIAALFFGFARGILAHSAYPWTPYVMEPFLLWSYLLLLLGYQKKKYLLLLFGALALSVSVAIHYSALGMVPMYLLLVFFVVYQLYESIWRYLWPVFVFFGSLLLFHFFAVFRFFESLFTVSSSSFPTPSLIFIPSVLTFLKRVAERGSIFLKFIFINDSTLHWIVLGILCCTIFYFFVSASSRRSKYHAALLLGSMAQFFLFVVMRPDLSYGVPFPIRYLTPLWSIAFIFIAEIVCSLLRENRIWYRIAGAGLIAVLFVGVFSPGLFRHSLGKPLVVFHEPPTVEVFSDTNLALDSRILQSTAANPLKALGVYYVPLPELEEIKEEIFTIQKEEQRQDFNFLAFKSYIKRPDGSMLEDDYANEILVVALEEDLGVRLTTVDNTKLRRWRSLGDGKYLFLRCPPEPDTAQKVCANAFLDKYPAYQLVRPVAPSSRQETYLFRLKESAG